MISSSSKSRWLFINLFPIFSALHDALFHNQMDVVRAMLKAASDCSNGQEFLNAQNNSKQTPLHISVVKNQTEAVALLLQNGADPNTPDVNGNTTIHLAATDSHLIDCLQLLLHSHKGFKISKLNERNYAGKSPCGDCSFQSHLAYTNEFRLLQWCLRINSPSHCGQRVQYESNRNIVSERGRCQLPRNKARKVRFAPGC